MPNTREKLIELLDEASEKLKELCGGLNDHNGNGVRADHLIANGVTVQQWIPASEPPNKMKPVICLYKNEDGTQVGGGYVNDHGIWTLIAPAKGTITHWMPLPQPQKGE